VGLCICPWAAPAWASRQAHQAAQLFRSILPSLKKKKEPGKKRKRNILCGRLLVVPQQGSTRVLRVVKPNNESQS
jgi:hypothetical protein